MGEHVNIKIAGKTLSIHTDLNILDLKDELERIGFSPQIRSWNGWYSSTYITLYDRSEDPEYRSVTFTYKYNDTCGGMKTITADNNIGVEVILWSKKRRWFF